MTGKTITKVILSSLLALTLFCAPLAAQNRRHDISLSYGVVTLDQLSDIFEDILTIVITLGTFSKENMDFSGAPFLSYHFAPRGRFGFGIAAGTYRTTGGLTTLGSPAGTFKETNTIAALEMDYRWVYKPSFQLYSGLGAGLRFRKGQYDVGDELETTNNTFPTFHVNALGLRFGKQVGLFFELGFGYKGVLNGGLSAQF
jgi:hypothetical protein